MAVICRSLSIFTLCLLLPGCAGTSDRLKSVVQAARPGGMAGQRIPALTPAQARSGQLLSVELPGGAGRALAARVATTGGAETFSTTDPLTLTLRQGRLVETRGLPQDLISADPGPPLSALRSGARHSGLWQVIGADDQVTDIRLDCAVRLCRSGGLRRIEEHCTGPGFSVINQFVTNAAHSLLWSRQWVGPAAGYALLRRPDQPDVPVPSPLCSGEREPPSHLAENAK
ncbi:YjbF family lipoprotein [Falsigemmobacter intermedius]|uniref:YjbF family lipoprotein n=1 Tax=Falsigemmobacter intermedius TaxID=1553448 RepID=UPI003F07BDED